MLSATDIDRFKRQLETQRDALEQRISSLDRDLAAPAQYDDATEERGDDAKLLEAHDDDWDQLAFARTELAQVQKALVRIEDGTYGTSEVSCSPIPLDRLEAEPSATTLVSETPPR
jgi:RNA polymerase-binding transcription factor DksA